MGKFSRNKGKRVEHTVVTYFKTLQLDARRIPMSGAGTTEKGDIKIEIPNTRYGPRPMDAEFLYAEVKSRKDEYNPIYAMIDARPNKILDVELDGVCFKMSYNFKDLGLLGEPTSTFFQFIDKFPDKEKRILRKVGRMYQYLKGSDLLIIKSDYKPLIFIRYY